MPTPTPKDAETRVPFSIADQHTRAIMKLAREEVTAWQPVGAEAVGLPTEQGGVSMIDVIPSILEVPRVDEDNGDGVLLARITGAALDRLPVIDDPAPWESSDAADAFIEANFADTLPTPSVEWTDTTSDRAIERLAMQGLAAHRLEPVNDPADEAAFVVDLSWMVAFPVRSGFLPYGASAYFDANGAVLRIHVAHDNRTYTPGDDGWEQAKWVWKSSLIAAVTVVDHLGSTHYVASNLVTTVARETLPPDHPLRRLIKAFTYGAVDINRLAASQLSNKGGLANRTFAFTYEGLSRLLLRGVESPDFEPFPKRMDRTESLGDRYLFRRDGLALYDIFSTYVQDYLALYFSDNEVVRDDHVQAFWQGLQTRAPGLGLRPLATAQQFEETLTEFMFSVTGMHAQVGTIVDYLVDPAFMGAKVSPGQRQADAQSTIQVLNLVILTGFEQPPLIGDYRHLLLDEEARVVFDQYQESLETLSDQIETRNRTLDQPYQIFNPALLDTSVST
ncbi:MAG: lipoxygenase family protein [Actinomycetota bacterium]